MKAKDLMIDDYIEENIDEEGCQAPCCWVPHQVTAEDFKFWLENNWIDADEKAFSEFWRPIPLTKEILEKNFPRDTAWVCAFILSEGVNIYQKEESVWCIQYMEMSEIRYFHELQHLLKDCKIHKDFRL